MISFAAFEGVWQIQREIADALSGPGRFTGRAQISPMGAGALRYAEEGRLTLAQGTSFTAARQYHWTEEPEEGGVAVHFADGRFFHRFSLGAQAEAAHFCDPDQYDVTYDFADWPRWQARWRVTGPRKDYVMTSRYARA
ncbi:DUF6314 family protein [Dinoroseobacter sp. S375]|uniref:DUF6314 family protein n=1 Tax=Dinoroseobacter sp. S375 TaxID=3415136 RepID=UPI003C7A54A0